MNGTWTEREIDSLGVRTALVTACSVLGIGGRTKAYELHRRGDLPFPTIQSGNRIICPMAPIRALLGLPPHHADARAAGPNGAGACNTGPDRYTMRTGSGTAQAMAQASDSNESRTA